jgi:hypothetical protein
MGRSLTPKGREAMARSVIGGGLSKAAAARQFNTTPKTVAKMGRAFPRRGRGRLAGPFIEAALIAKPDGARRLRGGRGFAKTAPYRRADRRRGRRFGGNCQPHPQTPGPRPACRRSSRPNRSVAMNGQPPARSSTSTSKSWASSVGLAIGSRTSGPARAIRAGVGWEHVHLAIDEPFPSRPFRNPAGRKTSVLPALSLQLFNALRFFPNLGVKVERVMTDNGSSFRSHRYAKALRRLKIKHLRTRPYTQGRALRPDQPAPMGLRQGLQHLRTTRRRTAHLAAPLQLASPSWQYRLQAINQQAQPTQRQRVEALQLGDAICVYLPCVSGAELVHRGLGRGPWTAMLKARALESDASR